MENVAKTQQLTPNGRKILEENGLDDGLLAQMGVAVGDLSKVKTRVLFEEGLLLAPETKIKTTYDPLVVLEDGSTQPIKYEKGILAVKGDWKGIINVTTICKREKKVFLKLRVNGNVVIEEVVDDNDGDITIRDYLIDNYGYDHPNRFLTDLVDNNEVHVDAVIVLDITCADRFSGDEEYILNGHGSVAELTVFQHKRDRYNIKEVYEPDFVYLCEHLVDRPDGDPESSELDDIGEEYWDSLRDEL